MDERRKAFGYDCMKCKRECHLCNFTKDSDDPIIFNALFADKSFIRLNRLAEE